MADKRYTVVLEYDPAQQLPYRVQSIKGLAPTITLMGHREDIHAGDSISEELAVALGSVAVLLTTRPKGRS